MGARLHVTGGSVRGGRGVDGEAAVAGTLSIRLLVKVTSHYS